MDIKQFAKLRVERLRILVKRPYFRSVAIAFVSSAFIFAVHWSPGGDAVQVNVANRLLFWARSQWTGPGLDPRIKIFSYDDQTASRFRALDLKLEEWALVFQALDKKKPAMILIDKLFDRPLADGEGAAFAEVTKTLTTPIVADAFVADFEVKFRSKLPLDRDEFKIEKLLERGPPPDWLRLESGHAYGPDPQLQKSFKYVGHAVYHSSARVRMLLRVSETSALPHWSLFAGGDVRIRDGELWTGEQRVPLDGEGRAQVNVDQRSVYGKRAFSFMGLLEAARKKLDIPVVNAGDYVVILPAMYTGNTDFRETPFGSMQGGYIMTALLNSVLTKQWLTIVDDFGIGVVVFGALGFALGAYSSATLIVVFLALAALATVAVSAFAFVFGGFVLPFILPLVSLLISTAAVYSDRFRLAQLEQVRVEHELRTAQVVQESYIPRKRFEGRGLIIDGFFEPASQCGGDYWGHFSPAPGIEFVLIGDATGHGVPAALLTAASYAACHMVAELWSKLGTELMPSDVLTHLNRVLLATQGENLTMTFFVAKIDMTKSEVMFSNAGHNFPYIVYPPMREGITKDKPYKTLMTPPGSVLGFNSTSTYSDKALPFLPGDRLFLYTDGLIENRGAKGQMWGKSRLQRHLIALAGKPFGEMMSGFVNDARAFYVGPRDDDTTIVLVERPAI